MADLKLCKDCRWCEAPHGIPFCRRPTPRQALTGFEKGREIGSCEVQRSVGYFWARFSGHDREWLCGKEGRWFEPRETAQAAE